jgi:hypothetical protein
MNLNAIGWARAIRGARDGDQSLLLTGLGLIFFQYLRTSKQKKQLIYRKVVPVGSTLVVRHARRGDPRIEIRKPPRRSKAGAEASPD